jgi:ubiquinone/menaquinone biosynthesis C-methylase UbiE
LAVARAIGDSGRVRATDKSEEMVRVCGEQVARANFATAIECLAADAKDASGGPWDAIVCAFGLWQLDDRPRVLSSWRAALAPAGKIGIITWGPGEAQQPFDILQQCLRESEPSYDVPSPHMEAQREAMQKMFESARLELVRHTIVRHTLSFASAEAFFKAMSEACTWRRVWEELGPARLERIATRFYERVGGPDAPLSFEPPATLAIATLPGAEVDLEVRSIRGPTKPPPRS